MFHKVAALVLHIPGLFSDQAFIKWLNSQKCRVMTWHQKGEKIGSYSDVLVMVDPSLTGEGSDSDMPTHLWEQIISACREAYPDPSVLTGQHHVMVRLEPFDIVEGGNLISSGKSTRTKAFRVKKTSSPLPKVVTAVWTHTRDQYAALFPGKTLAYRQNEYDNEAVLQIKSGKLSANLAEKNGVSVNRTWPAVRAYACSKAPDIDIDTFARLIAGRHGLSGPEVRIMFKTHNKGQKAA